MIVGGDFCDMPVIKKFKFIIIIWLLLQYDIVSSFYVDNLNIGCKRFYLINFKLLCDVQYQYFLPFDL